MTRILTSLLVVAAVAGAQEVPGDPGFPRSGKHFDHLATFRPEHTVKKILDDVGALVIHVKKTNGSRFNQLLVDMNGQQVVKALFANVESLGQGYVQAYAGNTWWLIHVVTKRSWKSSRKFGLLESGEILLNSADSNKSFVCRVNGTQLTPISAAYNELEPDGKGTFWARKNGMWGVVSVDGSIKLPFQYSGTGARKWEIAGDYRIVSLELTDTARKDPKHKLRRSNRTGLVTASGKQVLPFYYTSIDAPVGNVVTWEIGKKTGATDLRTKKVLLQLEDLKVGNKTLMGYSIENVDGKWLRVTKREPNPLGAAYASRSSYKLYRIGSGYVTKDWCKNIDVHGKVFAVRQGAKEPFVLHDAQFRPFARGVDKISRSGELFSVTPTRASKGMPYLIDGSGRLVARGGELKTYTTKALSYHDRIPMSKQGLFGFLDLGGRPAIPPRFKNIGYFSAHGLATAKTETGWGVIDRTGKFVAEPNSTVAYCFPKHPYYYLRTKDTITLHGKNGEEYFKAQSPRFSFGMIRDDRLAVWEVVNKKLVRWFVFALK